MHVLCLDLKCVRACLYGYNMRKFNCATYSLFLGSAPLQQGTGPKPDKTMGEKPTEKNAFQRLSPRIHVCSKLNLSKKL